MGSTQVGDHWGSPRADYFFPAPNFCRLGDRLLGDHGFKNNEMNSLFFEKSKSWRGQLFLCRFLKLLNIWDPMYFLEPYLIYVYLDFNMLVIQ